MAARGVALLGRVITNVSGRPSADTMRSQDGALITRTDFLMESTRAEMIEWPRLFVRSTQLLALELVSPLTNHALLCRSRADAQ